jgi:transposase
MVPKINVHALADRQRVGIDISEETFDACIRTVGDSKAKACFKNNGIGMDQFRRWLKKNDVDNPELWMEATARYFEKLAEWAIKLGWKVVVANPRAVRHFAKSKLKLNKTDKLDAAIILRFAESSDIDEFRYWTPRSAAGKELRDLQVAIRGLKKEIGQEQCRLKSGLISQIAKDSIRQTIAFLQSQVKTLHRESMRVIKADPELNQLYRWLDTIKGFGEVTIALILWKIDFNAFRKGRQLVKFAGLDTVVWESGKSVRRKQRISRVGHADLRSALFLPAITAMTHDPDTANFAKSLIDRGSEGKVVICAVMARLLRVAFARVRDGKKALLQSA